MLISKEFEKHILECLKEAIQDAAPDLFDDLVADNPEYWAGQLNSIFLKEVKLALKDKRLMREILLEIIEEQYDFEDMLRGAINGRKRISKSNHKTSS